MWWMNYLVSNTFSKLLPEQRLLGMNMLRKGMLCHERRLAPPLY